MFLYLRSFRFRYPAAVISRIIALGELNAQDRLTLPEQAMAEVQAITDAADTLGEQGDPLAYIRRGAPTSPPPPPVEPIPRAEWPCWASFVARLAKAPDTGVGDTVERCLRAPVVAQTIHAVLPENCGCAARRVKWNAEYPYA